jgi:hypothetical protein
MKELSKVKRLKLRDVWPKEAANFTPWLADNIDALAEALGMELELEAREAGVGEFSLDLLVKEPGTNRVVVVENQLTPTDHDHLGKLLTYAAGFGASVVVWISETIRDEHREALEWLNQHTDSETDFFGVVVEVLQIDDSRPAYNFKIVVSPNEWQKAKRGQATGHVSQKEQAYRQYFQPLIDELREKHKYTGARIAQPQSWYSFSSGISGIYFNATFAGKDLARVELYIDWGDVERNKALFDWLHEKKEAIEEKCGTKLHWERLDHRRACRISAERKAHIEMSPEELEQVRRWHIENLLVFKKVIGPLVREGVAAQAK